jgi:hypothetical protein
VKAMVDIFGLHEVQLVFFGGWFEDRELSLELFEIHARRVGILRHAGLTSCSDTAYCDTTTNLHKLYIKN